MPKPRISLIVPVHNAGSTLGKLIESIRQQTFARYEAIFVNDASDDESEQIVTDAVIRDDRFRLINLKENVGPGCARNRGMESAKGTYIMFADADDLLYPTCFEAAYSRAEAADADIVVYQARHWDAETRESRPSPDRWDPALFPEVFSGAQMADCLFTQFKNWPWDKLFRRSFLERNELRFPSLYRSEDLPFTCEALALAERIAPLDEELYRYQVNSATSSTSTRDKHPIDFLDACRFFHRFLVGRGLMETFRADYTRWIGLCVYVNLTELRTYDAFHEVFDALKHGGLEDFELLGLPDSAFLDPLHGQIIRAIDAQFFEHFIFDLWRLDADRAKAYDQISDQLDQAMNSTSMKVGRTLVGIPQGIIEALRSR
ncbi:MAG: glycosyltransferase [Eggerthellaceae bacterium]|jgi:glycosyltransferase involved in cell wall biosynthesis